MPEGQRSHCLTMNGATLLQSVLWKWGVLLVLVLVASRRQELMTRLVEVDCRSLVVEWVLELAK